jgi:hypothetical protein
MTSKNYVSKSFLFPDTMDFSGHVGMDEDAAISAFTGNQAPTFFLQYLSSTTDVPNPMIHRARINIHNMPSTVAPVVAMMSFVMIFG